MRSRGLPIARQTPCRETHVSSEGRPMQPRAEARLESAGTWRNWRLVRPWDLHSPSVYVAALTLKDGWNFMLGARFCFLCFMLGFGSPRWRRLWGADTERVLDWDSVRPPGSTPPTIYPRYINTNVPFVAGNFYRSIKPCESNRLYTSFEQGPSQKRPHFEHVFKMLCGLCNIVRESNFSVVIFLYLFLLLFYLFFVFIICLFVFFKEWEFLE